MFVVHTVYRQRQPQGCDKPFDQCDQTQSGPFVSRESAERYATAVASQTPVFRAQIVEVAVNG